MLKIGNTNLNICLRIAFAILLQYQNKTSFKTNEMEKTNKINYKKASANMIERLVKVFNASVEDNWLDSNIGATITFTLPNFTNTVDVCSEAGLCIAIAKKRGLINNGSVSSENNEVIVKLF